MFDILSTYVIVEMLDSEDKAYRAKKQKISDKKDNNHKNGFLSARESDMFELLVTCIEEMDKTRRELDKLKSEIKKIDLG